MTEIQISLKTVMLMILFGFFCFMIVVSLTIIKALFRFPAFRREIWTGITNGDKIPHQDDFQRTAQLFWSFILGTGVVTCFCLWPAFPMPEWHYIVPAISGTFLICIGLKLINKKH